MSFYEKRILPHVINCACGSPAVARQREKVVPSARGRVLELGIGTGLNAKHYRAEAVTEVIGVDPSRESWALARAKIAHAAVPIEYCEASAEDIPLESDSIDTAVITYTLLHNSRSAQGVSRGGACAAAWWSGVGGRTCAGAG